MKGNPFAHPNANGRDFVLPSETLVRARHPDADATLAARALRAAAAQLPRVVARGSTLLEEAPERLRSQGGDAVVGIVAAVRQVLRGARRVGAELGGLRARTDAISAPEEPAAPPAPGEDAPSPAEG